MSNSVWDEFEKTNEETNGTPKKKFNRIDFTKEATQIRLLSDEGVKREYHFVSTGSGKGKPVICCGDGCPVCVTGDRPSPKWLFKALERETLNVGVVQMPKTAMKSIAKIKKLPIYGEDVKAYDIIVMKDTTKGQDGKNKITYSAQGLPRNAVPRLPEDVRARVKEEMDAIDLESVAVPYSPEQTLRYLGWPASVAPASKPSNPAPAQQAQANVPMPTTPSIPSGGQSSKRVDISKFLAKPEPDAEAEYGGPEEAVMEGVVDDEPLEF
jgi:hypothetical protein